MEFGRATINKLSLYREKTERVPENLARLGSTVNITINGFRCYLKDLYTSYKEALKEFGKSLSEYYTCPAGKTRMIIDADGSVYGCELFIPKLKEGNVRTRSLKEIWRSEFKTLRERDYRKIEVCETCKISNLCQAGCPARALKEYSTIMARDPLCTSAV